MKKQTIYSIFFVLLLIIAVSGGTYAYFSASAKSNQNASTSSSKFAVIFTGNSLLNGIMTPSSNKNGGLNTTVNIKVDTGSVEALAYLYINIESMSASLSTTGFIWEVYGYKNNQQIYTNSGNFNGYNDTTNNVVEIVSNYNLTETDTQFVVYLWIDGSQTGNEVIGATFSGYISANTENFTGELPTS